MSAAHGPQRDSKSEAKPESKPSSESRSKSYIARHLHSLTARTTLLFAASVGVVVLALGSFLYMSARNALEMNMDYALIGRVEHFRTLLHQMYNIEQLEAHPALFESMLGSEHDVFLFRRPGQAPFININPDALAVPPMPAVPIGRTIGRDALVDSIGPQGVKVRWTIAQAEPLGGGMVEIVAGHEMTQEVALLATYYRRVFLTGVIAVLAASVLGFLVLSRGLRPLRVMSERAAQITPKQLTTRLPEDAPTELRRLAHAFNAMLDRLAEGYERLTQFSADLAHEIRTPIGVLVGQTQVALAQPRTADEYQALLESNLEEFERIGRIAENILFLAQADHAGLAIDAVPLDLARELETVAEYFEGIAQERDLRFDIDASGTVHAQAMLWRRAISNLVVNAVRYAEANTVIRLRARGDSTDATQNAGQDDGQDGIDGPAGAEISVENIGATLAPEQLDRLFDRFYRGDAARSVSTESNGLGLAIVKAIMGLHGGSVDAACPDIGVIRFTLRFPPPDPALYSTPSR